MDGEAHDPPGFPAFSRAVPGAGDEEKQLGREPMAGWVQEERAPLEEQADVWGRRLAPVRGIPQDLDGSPTEGLAVGVECQGPLARRDADEGFVLPTHEAFTQRPRGVAINDGTGIGRKGLGHEDPCEGIWGDTLKDLAGGDVLQLHGDGASTAGTGTGFCDVLRH